LRVKEAVSVSLGDPRRDYSFLLSVGGERVRLRRVGTGGDVQKALSLLRDLDGQVAALGLGGVNFAYRVGDARYPLPLGERLRQAVRKTPLGDGSRWKELMEPELASFLPPGRGEKVFFSSVLDRYPLARALEERGYRVLAADAWSALGWPLVLPLGLFAPLARLALPLLRFLPLGRLYPHRDGVARRRGSAAARAGFRFFAGDFRLLRPFLPPDLRGISVLTGGLGREELELLRERGVSWLLTASPCLGDLHPSANALEALACALLGKRPEDLEKGELQELKREVEGDWVPMDAATDGL
jgi:hypothetical protein